MSQEFVPLELLDKPAIVPAVFPVVPSPPYLRWGINTIAVTAFLLCLYAAAFPGMLGCQSLLLSALLWLALPLLVIFAALTGNHALFLLKASFWGGLLWWVVFWVWLFQSPLLARQRPRVKALLTLLLTALVSFWTLPICMGVWVNAGALFEPWDGLVVLMAWLAFWMILQRPWRARGLRRFLTAALHWHGQLAPVLLFSLLLLLWAEIPLRVGFWLYRSDLERVVAEVREAEVRRDADVAGNPIRQKPGIYDWGKQQQGSRPAGIYLIRRAFVDRERGTVALRLAPSDRGGDDAAGFVFDFAGRPASGNRGQRIGTAARGRGLNWVLSRSLGAGWYAFVMYED
jgi:hypothetical protein